MRNIYITYLKIIIKIFISVSLIFISQIYSEEENSNDTEEIWQPSDDTPKQSVEFPTDVNEWGRKDSPRPSKDGGTIFSVDFELKALKSRGQGDGNNRRTEQGNGSASSRRGDENLSKNKRAEGFSENNTANGSNEFDQNTENSNSTGFQTDWSQRRSEIYHPKNNKTNNSQNINNILQKHQNTVAQIQNEANKYLDRIISQDISDHTTRSLWKDGTQEIIEQVRQHINHLNTQAPVTQVINMGGGKLIPTARRIVYPEAIIHPIMDKTVNAINKKLEQSLSSIKEQTSKLKKSTLESIVFSEENISNANLLIEEPESTMDLYERTVTDVASDLLKTKYSRRQLSVLEDENLTPPEEELYEFLSPEGMFLEKNRAVYEKLRASNPYHEQGILARQIGLSAVEVADEEFAEGNEPEAETAFQTAETMSDIALGIIPYVGTGKDFYELLTGKHLLTGRTLTLFERSMSVVGIALSGFSGGFVNSTQIKATLNITHRVVGKINQKLLDKFLRGLNNTQLARTIKDYPNTFFKSMEELGISSKEQVISSAKFVRRAFSRENPSIEELSRVIQVVGKEGIETYTKVIDELANFKPQLLENGKIFLARQLRFKDKIFKQTQKIVNEENLLKMGKTYAEKSSLITQVKKIVFKGRVWRGVNKKYIADEKDFWTFHPGMDSHIARYTVGERALYTSLKEATAIKEIMSRTELNTLEQIRQTHLIDQSKHIEIDKVLDLTDLKIRKQLDILDVDDIIDTIMKNPNAYDTTQVIGHIARTKRGVNGILAPSAHGGKNFISFKELE